MAVKQKSYKEQLMELYGAGAQNTGATANAGTGAAQAGTAQTGTAAQNGQTGNAMLDLIMNRKPFQYDPKTDPAAQAARKEAGYNARLATEGTLGSYAGMTGGIPSTAAVSAAAQAGNAALQTGADKVAELRNLAYQNYQTEGQNMQGIAALLLQQEADAYNRGRDALADQRYADELAYSREQAQKQWDYNLQQDEYQRKYDEAILAAQYGDTSKLKALGIDTSRYNAGGSSGGGVYRRGDGLGTGSVSGEDRGDGVSGALPTGAKNELTMAAYDNGGYVPPAVWNQYAAQYGEQALINAGFKKGKSNAGSGSAGGRKPEAGNNRENLMN